MSSLFDRLREAIKRTGKRGMFMYGMPSVSVITLLIRLYNENIIRTYYSPTGIYTCNNGSTCAESKMFSYLNHDIAVFKFNMIQGYAAFWLGDKQPPAHIIKGYNYDNHADPLFIEIKDDITPVIERGRFDTFNQATDKLNNFIQLFALPCPGCFSNYAAYTNNNMSKTDASDCVHVDIMSQVKRVKDRLLTTRGGGSRKKRTLRRRRHRVHATRHRRARK